MSEFNPDIKLSSTQIQLLAFSSEKYGLRVSPENLIDVAGLLDLGYVEANQEHDGLQVYATASGRHIVSLVDLRSAAQALLDDVRTRHPGEDLRCPHMIALDQALNNAGRAA
jgi:hypothetical protein